MQKSVTTKNKPGNKITHHVFKSKARLERASMLPRESSSGGRPSTKKLSVASIAILTLTEEITMNITAEMILGIKCLRIIQKKEAPVCREYTIYSLLRIWRISALTIRAKANQLVMPIITEMENALCFSRKERSSKRVSKTGML